MHFILKLQKSLYPAFKGAASSPVHTSDNVAKTGDIVAGVDGTLGFAAVLFSVNFKNPTSNLRDYQEERHKSYTTC